MGRNLLAIIAIFLCTALAWAILGTSIGARTQDAGEGLGPRVASTWGAPQQQMPPSATTTTRTTVQKPVQNTNAAAAAAATADPTAVVTTPVTMVTVVETTVHPLPIERSRIKVGLVLEQRQRGCSGSPSTASISAATISFATPPRRTR